MGWEDFVWVVVGTGLGFTLGLVVGLMDEGEEEDSW